MNANHRVRIVGGMWRSRLVDVADIPGLRPTPDRVRETLFNWLGQTLDGLACLDLFAGSGILGFEAASRGAASVTLVEQDSRAHAALRRNAEKLAATQIEIVRGDALEFLASTTRQFNVAFVDPPYRQKLLEQIMPLLGRVIPPGNLAYAEAEAPLDPPAGWRISRQSRAGQVHFYLLERTEAA
ncbi:MAG: 16S rRNA (guanine(966)-N(2))-methyltransferase RsmD [Azoarcus sp.]|jgi:16S rRNA (guanine(966)-N(2))-methyltransferase RsmD|nr:16S rRNA (guanine(966)-N(2))-methyltransferase RsmD [Azoarcus sp.]